MRTLRITNDGHERAKKQSLGEREGSSYKHRIKAGLNFWDAFGSANNRRRQRRRRKRRRRRRRKRQSVTAKREKSQTQIGYGLAPMVLGAYDSDPNF